jgi:hypothetical protein
MRQGAQRPDGVHALWERMCRAGGGVPCRWLTTGVMAATHGQPGVRAPGAWRCGSARVRRSVALGRHRRVGHAAAEDTGGRRARWHSACRVLCDCRALATAGARWGSHRGCARRCVRVVQDGAPPKPALAFSYTDCMLDQRAHLRRNIRLRITLFPTMSCMAMKKQVNVVYLILTVL